MYVCKRTSIEIYVHLWIVLYFFKTQNGSHKRYRYVDNNDDYNSLYTSSFFRISEKKCASPMKNIQFHLFHKRKHFLLSSFFSSDPLIFSFALNIAPCSYFLNIILLLLILRVTFWAMAACIRSKFVFFSCSFKMVVDDHLCAFYCSNLFAWWCFVCLLVWVYECVWVCMPLSIYLYFIWWFLCHRLIPNKCHRFCVLSFAFHFIFSHHSNIFSLFLWNSNWILLAQNLSIVWTFLLP